MQQQNQSTFKLRIADNGGAARCTATNDTQPTITTPMMRLADSTGNTSQAIDLAAVYRNSRSAAHYTFLSMRGGSYRRVG